MLDLGCTCACVNARVRVRVHRRMGCVCLAGVGCSSLCSVRVCRRAPLRTPGGGWGAAFACAGAWTPKVRLQPQGGAPGGSPGRVGGR